MRTRSLILLLFITLSLVSCESTHEPISYKVTIDDPTSGKYRVLMKLPVQPNNSIKLVMPVWTPGYYQRMNYAQSVHDLVITDADGSEVGYNKAEPNVWLIANSGEEPLKISYSIQTDKKFVANSYVDSTHAYVIGAQSFLYPKDRLSDPVEIELEYARPWQVVTGLEKANGPNQFRASDYDILYDCPILIGEIERLEPFKVGTAVHHFTGIELGDFDRVAFMNDLQKICQASSEIIGDVPFDEYTFIAIGSGRGGIEHLNNTTVSFDGSSLNTEEGRIRMLSFLTHEYFHHYNVKRIRPHELGPFDYQHGSRTNQLWISEGITVYYESLILQLAGLISSEEALRVMASQINRLQSNPGRKYQTLKEASYNTWKDGPFGEVNPDETVSVYNKGAVVGMILDLAIRHYSQNKHSLDDVMRQLYFEYDLKLKRGFTESEFQQLCEELAGTSLTEVFRYVYTTEEVDYEKYLEYAGLKLVSDSGGFQMVLKENSNDVERKLLDLWVAQ